MKSKQQIINGLDYFTRWYLITALWSSTDLNGEPLDGKYTIEDFTLEALKSLVGICKTFQEKNKTLLNEVYDKFAYRADDAGHDFWLTQNHHGAGYFDQSPKAQVWDDLTKASHDFKEITLYPNKGKIHLSF